MSRDTKILTGLMERRALETQFAALAETSDPGEVVRLAEEIAAYDHTALSLLLARLDTDDPRWRGSLGQVAKRLDRNQVISALRGVVHARERSDQARLSAVTILSRFLDEPVDESLLADIQDPDGAAVGSLRELMQAMDRDALAILEYLSQLAEQPPEVAGMILAAVPRLTPQPHLVTLLRMFAQGESQPLAHSAIEQLGRMRSTDALLALAALAATLPPARCALAERNRRKLRMRGVSEPAHEAEGEHWRVLLSPVDGAGTQVIWFINRRTDRERDTWLTVIARDPEGIVASFGTDEALDDQLPPQQPLGSIHTLPQEAGAPLQLVETSIGSGRRAVRRALERHWEAHTLPPLEYRLLNSLIWNADGTLDEPAALTPGTHSAAQTAALLDHPALASWFWRDDALLDAARRLGSRQGSLVRTRQIRVLVARHFGPEVVASYRRRLEAIADWLALASQPQASALAVRAAVLLAEETPTESLFVRRLVGTALDIAAVSLQANPA